MVFENKILKMIFGPNRDEVREHKMWGDSQFVLSTWYC